MTSFLNLFFATSASPCRVLPFTPIVILLDYVNNALNSCYSRQIIVENQKFCVFLQLVNIFTHLITIELLYGYPIRSTYRKF